MGQYRITIVAVGNHGCQRERVDGEIVLGCGTLGCPDCDARAFVGRLKERNSVESATLEHWPDTPSQVTDNLLTGIRSGSF